MLAAILGLCCAFVPDVVEAVVTWGGGGVYVRDGGVFQAAQSTRSAGEREEREFNKEYSCTHSLMQRLNNTL